ncbi:putative RNA methyltransferase [Paenibacillus agilis]|uniref:putative RNA methyltransferase n=1 Tax=Paenibacillus agilis TaxID=3020863 RepID=UPI0021BDC190|nr:methyltransferase domain-containing protein [Paenibacillus agilis]
MLTNKTKLDDSICLLTNHQHIFACPICSQSMMVQSRSLVCGNHHSFDIAKQGYVNLLSRAHTTKYDKQLFTARSAISADGFFEPMLEGVHAAIKRAIRSTVGGVKILDAGCGEGSHLSEILFRLNEHSNDKHFGVGIDIAKAGISLASRKGARDSGTSRTLKGYGEYGTLDTIWCVADLAKCPFADQSFDVIVNVMSPAKYTEFQRLLADEGLIIKVVPESHYLKQLRGEFYSQTDKDVYSNEQTVELFRHHFELLDIQRVQYEATLNKDQLQQLIQMTPLSWGAPEETLRKMTDLHQSEVTFDYSILIGSKKERE